MIALAAQGTAVAAWIICTFVSRMIVGPIHRLRSGAELVGSGQLADETEVRRGCQRSDTI